MASEVQNNATSKNNTNSFYTLRVTNVPDDLEQDGLKSIFLNSGHVTGMTILKGKNEAYVSYSTYQAAERAIHELHNEPPFLMKLEFRDKKMQSYCKPTKVDLSGPLPDFRYKNFDAESFKNMPKAINMGKPNFTPTMRPDTITPDDDLLYPYPTDSHTFNPYESPGPYYNTNLMYTRGITSVSRDGRRFVVNGRGCTYYDLPEPHLEMENALQKVYEKREYGMYEYASHEPDDESGTCEVCSAPTAFRCQKCTITFYCGRNCQVKDWKNHKENCHSIPPLVKKMSGLKIFGNGNCNESVARSESHPHTPSSEPRAVPKTPQLQISSQTPNENKERPPSVTSNNQANGMPPKSPAGSAKNYNGNQHSPNGDQRKGSSRSGSFHSNRSYQSKQTERESMPKQSSPPHQNQRPQQRSQQPQQQQQQQRPQQRSQQQQKQHQRPQQQQQQKQQNQRQSTFDAVKNGDEAIVFDESKQFLPRDQWVSVSVLNCTAPGEYYVQRVDKLDALEEFKAVLATAAGKAKFVEPTVDDNCVLEFEGEWYRVNVLSVDNDEVEVFFLDYGIADKLVITKVFQQTFADYPYFARRIRLVEGSHGDLKNFEGLTVKLVSTEENGTLIVQAKPAADAVKKVAADPEPNKVNVHKEAVEEEKDLVLLKLNSLPNIMDKIKPDVNGGIVMLHAKLDQNSYNASLMPTDHLNDFEMLIGDLKVACEALVEKHRFFKPQIGDFVCGENKSNEWYRGIVSSVEPTVKLAVVDECRFFVPQRCSPMPVGFDKIDCMGLICELKPDTKLPENLEGGGEYTVVKINQDSVTIKIKSQTEVISEVDARLKKWVPKPEQKGIQLPKLVSGNRVVMLQMMDPASCYVNIVETEEKERVHKLVQDVEACARNRKPITQKPVVGEMVLSMFADGNHYRAVVIKVDEDKFLIRYTEYGNEEIKKMSELFQLPDSLKSQPAGCIKVTLKGVDKNQPPSAQAADLLMSLIQEEIPLKCTFEGDPVKDGVILMNDHNDSVNDAIKDALKPNWKKNIPESNKVYTLDDLPSSKLGDIGQEVSVIPLLYYPLAGTIVVAPDDETAIQAVQVDMAEKIAKYVAETNSHYVPRDNELCIAKYEGEFYRGLCLDTNISPTESSVFFLDYGNTDAVKHEDIRRITPDFLGFGALGIVCNVQSAMFPQGLKDPAKKRLQELIPINEQVIAKIIQFDDAGLPCIEIPSIRVALIKEKLI